jgi:GNAT superfamily N-acetyltransferase
MNGGPSIEAPAAPAPPSGRAGWRVRAAVGDDIAAIAAAVGELLAELGATPPAAPAMEATARALIHDRDAGAVLVAECEGALIGVLGASWQNAIHIPGRYGLIQDLWVQPSWRGSGVGGGLLAALCELARERGVARLEVGLPREHFAGLAVTEAFYAAHGFTALGARMRRSLT